MVAGEVEERDEAVGVLPASFGGVAGEPQAQGVVAVTVLGVGARVGEHQREVARLEAPGEIGLLVELDGHPHRVFAAGDVEVRVGKHPDAVSATVPTRAAQGGGDEASELGVVVQVTQERGLEVEVGGVPGALGAGRSDGAGVDTSVRRGAGHRVPQERVPGVRCSGRCPTTGTAGATMAAVVVAARPVWVTALMDLRRSLSNLRATSSISATELG